jgi:hypothetical protein
MSKYEDDGMPSFGKVAAWIVGIFVLCWVLGAAVFGVRVMTANLVGRGEAHIQIQSAGSRISAYNHFFDLCASVQQAEAGIDQQTALADKATTADDKARAETNIAALQMTRANGIYQYNADAAKNYTVGQFKDSDLPWELSDKQYKAGDPHSQCAYGH